MTDSKDNSKEAEPELSNANSTGVDADGKMLFYFPIENLTIRATDMEAAKVELKKQVKAKASESEKGDKK